MATPILRAGSLIAFSKLLKQVEMRILSLLLCLLPAAFMFSQILEIEGDVDLKNNRIENLANPTGPLDAANKAYVDAMAGVSEKLLEAGLNGIVEDVEGNIYKTIKIGTQVWMAENLRTTHYNNGNSLPKVTNNTTWSALSTPAYCWYNNDSLLNARLLGALYNYFAVADTNLQKVCPLNWHMPSDMEYTVLTGYLASHGYGYEGSGTDIGKSMASTSRWLPGNGTPDVVSEDPGSNNLSGFNGLLSGLRISAGLYLNLNFDAYWWSSTEASAGNAWSHTLDVNSAEATRANVTKRSGYSVRCVRD